MTVVQLATDSWSINKEQLVIASLCMEKLTEIGN